MPKINYISILQQEFAEYSTRLRQRQEIDFDLSQREQFIRATVNMLPEEERVSWETLLNAMTVGDVGLSDSIRNVLKSAPRKFYTASEIKNMLVKSGFDFSKYTASPLSSVHAALKRLKPEDAELSQIDGVMAWKWVAPSTGQRIGVSFRKIKMLPQPCPSTAETSEFRAANIVDALKKIEEVFGKGAVYRTKTETKD